MGRFRGSGEKNEELENITKLLAAGCKTGRTNENGRADSCASRTDCMALLSGNLGNGVSDTGRNSVLPDEEKRNA